MIHPRVNIVFPGNRSCLQNMGSKPQDRLISHASSVLDHFENESGCSQHTERESHLLLWPYQLPFDRWPFILAMCCKTEGSPHITHRDSQRILPETPRTETDDEQEPCPFSGCQHGRPSPAHNERVSGAGLGSSLETSAWDCHKAIKSIIFHVRSQYLEG